MQSSSTSDSSATRMVKRSKEEISPGEQQVCASVALCFRNPQKKNGNAGAYRDDGDPGTQYSSINDWTAHQEQKSRITPDIETRGQDKRRDEKRKKKGKSHHHKVIERG